MRYLLALSSAQPKDIYRYIPKLLDPKYNRPIIKIHRPTVIYNITVMIARGYIKDSFRTGRESFAIDAMLAGPRLRRTAFQQYARGHGH